MIDNGEIVRIREAEKWLDRSATNLPVALGRELAIAVAEDLVALLKDGVDNDDGGRVAA